MKTRVLMLGALMLFSSGVRAQNGRVAFELRDSSGRPVDGELMLRDAGGRSFRCVSTASRCSLAVPVGRYQVTVAPRRERAPASRQITVIAGRTVTLRMRTLPGASVPAMAPITSVPIASGVTVRPPGNASGAARRPTVRAGTRPPGPRATTERTDVRNPNSAVSTASRRRVLASSPAGRPTAPGQPESAIAVRPTVQVHPAATQLAPAVAVAPNGAGSASGSMAAAAPRDLGRGRQACVMGRVVDRAGRPMDATLTFSREGRTVGAVTSTAGRFTAFDLPPGRYVVQVVSRRNGQTTQLAWTVSAGSTLRPVVRLP